jgi:lactoylglutathione lyase
VRAEPYAAQVAQLVGINHVVLEVGDVDDALAFRSQPPDGKRHLGLVVDDRAQLDEHDFHDPWGNRIQVLAGMGLGGLEKSESALRELRDKGLA